MLALPSHRRACSPTENANESIDDEMVPYPTPGLTPAMKPSQSLAPLPLAARGEGVEGEGRHHFERSSGDLRRKPDAPLPPTRWSRSWGGRGALDVAVLPVG